ncbi:MAG: threonine--tRNA ligase [Clostridia bacterium]|nr:threonine--tRNA ligase [Clostridia bacterium]
MPVNLKFGGIISMKIMQNNGVSCEIDNKEEELHIIRHTAAHIMAQAIKRLYPEAIFAYGPATEKGFYYDVDLGDTKLTDDDLLAIEREMKKITKENLPIKAYSLPRDEAVKLMEERGEKYKVEHIADLPDDAVITFYQQGDYIDMCVGPHLCYTKALKAFKITKLSGAYWKNDKNNKMLTRVNGTAFHTNEELDEYLKMVAEAEKRDHNKIGRDLEFFTTVDSIGQGLPILLPKGSRVIQLLQRWVEDTEQKRDYLLTKTPLMAKRDLYKISGHWDHYLDGMFILGDPNDYTKECFALRPMTCPFQYQVFLNKKRSYRDLPMRLGETSTLFRNEDSGEMHGLIRVRQFTISEGHLILRPEQLAEEFKGCLDLAKYCLETVGLWEDCTFRFSQWDPNRTDKYEGTAEQWDEAQAIMGRILDDIGLDYEIGIDEAAFYGPKLDIQCKNVFGKEDTIVTIQIDMLLAKKFGMEYVDSNNQMTTPYIIHRTSLGCYERTLALILEKYAGALPLWLSPTQVVIVPVNSEYDDYAKEIQAKMQAEGIRVECDLRNETMGKRIREAQLQKVNYVIVVGANEKESESVSLRARGGIDLGVMPIEAMLERLTTEINNKVK